MPKKKIVEQKLTKPSPRPSAKRSVKTALKNEETKIFPFIGIGASAGGLEALKSFVSNVPKDSGMAYIVIVHMSPGQPSMLAELLQKVSLVPVTSAKDNESIKPDHIYVVPPNSDINVYKGKIQLLDKLSKGLSLPIDFFLRSLAQDKGLEAAGIILSGTGTDGTLGVKEIKLFDGLVLAQSEESAKYDGMPRSAIDSGVVDMVLAPEEMPEKLAHFFYHFNTAAEQKPSPTDDTDKNWLNKIYSLLRLKIGHDFSLYKKNTIIRRINRRMSLNQIKDFEIYIRFLRENPEEPALLFRELLIGVTNFFRDEQSYEILKQKILPDLLDQRPEDSIFRVWVPACSTGEEAYSLAMIFKEYMDKSNKRISLQLFGTDINKHAVEKARAGIYPDSIVADVNAKRLTRFFIKKNDSYLIKSEIRDCVVFSVQDVLKDPPFSKLNMLCCRNLLIYFDTKAQKKILPLFHYTLFPGGVLMLGSSETIGGATDLFEVLDSKWKIFKRKEQQGTLRQLVEFPTGLPENNLKKLAVSTVAQKKRTFSDVVKTIVLEDFSPPAVLIDSKGTILYIQGRTGKYLEPASGSPSQNVFSMARQGLKIELQLSLKKAITSGNKIMREGISVLTNGDFQPINLHVLPLKRPAELAGKYLLVFEDKAKPLKSTSAPSAVSKVTDDSSNERIVVLENELQNSHENHQITTEELESSNEELKSTNEELQSSNEELQSTNEEMESSKEELQSLNEELQTVNSELQNKVELLSTAQDDMSNLLNSTEIATIFVDNDGCVKRFTQEATKIINLIQTDIGRPLKHVVPNLISTNLEQDLENVLKKLTSNQSEVRTTDGNWYNMRIIPYRTTDNRIVGAVLTFSSIDSQKKSHKALEKANAKIEQAWSLVRSVFDINPYPMSVHDQDGKIVIANSAFLTLFSLSSESLKNFDLFEKTNGLLKAKDRESFLDIETNFKTVTIQIDGPKDKTSYKINRQVIKQSSDLPAQILFVFEEILGKDGKHAQKSKR
jgi:two-component system CheB/CheR fusion protein